DVGCSLGLLLYMAKERGFEPCGVDLSLNAVRYARDRLGLSVHQGTLFDARFSDGAFDVVTMVSVLEHVPNPLQTLDEIFRVLRPGGILHRSSPQRELLSPPRKNPPILVLHRDASHELPTENAGHDA